MKMSNFTNSSQVEEASSDGSSRDVFVLVIISTMMGALIILTLLGNLLIIAAFYLCKELRTITNYFLISLSVADFLTALLAMPIFLAFRVIDARVFPGGVVFEKIWRSVDIICGTASIWNLCLVSLDRCLAVSVPLKHMAILTPFRAKVVILLVWAFSMVLSSLLLVNWNYRGYLITTLSFFLPLLIIIFSYAKIYQVKTRTCKVRRSGGTNLKRDFRSAKQMVLVIGMFILCWVGFFVLTVSLASGKITVDALALHLLKALTYLNSCINPVLFTLVSQKFKKAFVQILHCQRPNLRVKHSSVGRRRRKLRSESDKSSIANNYLKLQASHDAKRSEKKIVERETCLWNEFWTVLLRDGCWSL